MKIKVRKRTPSTVRKMDLRGSTRAKYRTLVERKAKGQTVNETKVGPLLVLLGKSLDAFDKDVALAIQRGKAAAMQQEAEKMQPEIDRLIAEVSALDREREKLAGEFRSKVEAIQQKRDILYGEYRSLRDVQTETRQQSQRI